jgi:hypothetical protein
MTERLKTIGWAAECREWQAIGNELAARAPDGVSAYQVSLEQRKRMLARGERPMTYEEILSEMKSDGMVGAISSDQKPPDDP